MKVTEVRISPAKADKVRAFASVVFDDCFIVNDLRVMEGREGQLFVTMPARKTRNGQMRDVAHPLNGEMREHVERRVLEEYESAVENLVIPNRDQGGTARREGRGSMMERLAARLFNEEFWVAELPDRNTNKE